MEQSLSRRLEAMDRRLNGLLRKAALVAVTLAAMALALMLLPYCWPFVLAFAFSRMLEPFVRMAAKGRIRLGRKAAAALGVLLLFGVAGALAAALVTRLTRELVRALPQAAAWVGEVGVPWLRGLYGQVRAALPDLLPDVLDNALASLAQSAVGWAASLSAALTSGAFSTAASIPHALLGTVLLVMGTYYMTADRARIAALAGPRRQAAYLPSSATAAACWAPLSPRRVSTLSHRPSSIARAGVMYVSSSSALRSSSSLPCQRCMYTLTITSPIRSSTSAASLRSPLLPAEHVQGLWIIIMLASLMMSSPASAAMATRLAALAQSPTTRTRTLPSCAVSRL